MPYPSIEGLPHEAYQIDKVPGRIGMALGPACLGHWRIHFVLDEYTVLGDLTSS